MSNGGKALQAGDHHIILAERTVDDELVSTFISATYDSHMLIIGIEHQIAGLGLIPRDGGTVGVLHVGTAAVAYDVLSIRDIVKYPIDKSAAVQSIGSICVGGGVAVRPYLGELAPAGVPADHQGLPAPEVVDLAHQSAGGLYHGPALRVQVSGQIRQQLLCRGVGDREISSQGGQHSHLSSCSIQ